MLPQNIFDKIGAIWCILSVPKLVIINLKINIFWMINQQPKFCAIFFSKIKSDAHFGTKINTFSFYNSPQKPKRSKKMEAYIFYTSCEDISCNDVYSTSC